MPSTLSGMAKSFFEAKLDKAIAECATAALNVPLGDSHAHAMVKGRAAGLQDALALYRQAIRQDVEDQDAA